MATPHRHAAAHPMVLRIELGCDFTEVRAAADRVQAFLETHGCQAETLSDCELAMVEGCNNAIKHTPSRPDRQGVIVEVQVEPEVIELRIIDHGPGFSWPENARLPEPQEESGRGLYLIRTLTDYAAYCRRSRENILVLRKNRAP